MNGQNGETTDDGASAGALSDRQRLDWLRLIRSDNVGPRTFRQLINRYGGASAALEALPRLIASAKGARKIRIASRDACMREYEALLRMGGRLLAVGESGYPSLLRQIDTAPPLLAALGELTILRKPMVAIVGARNASAAGLAMTERLAAELAGHGYTIVSGLARGVDRRAHAATLTSGTIAVLAGGFDHIYPAEHRDLAERICDQGVLITEMPLGWQPRGRDFPRRNRIVSGLAYGTIVIEASRRSGSLITARFAAEQGREVFAVPGSPLDPRCEGPNELLRQGATICLNAEHVVEALAPMREGSGAGQMMLDEGEVAGVPEEDLWDETDLFGAPEVPKSMAGMELDEAGQAALAPAAGGEIGQSIEDLLGPSPVTIDELVRLSGLSVPQVKMALVELELVGKLERHGGDLVSLLR